jgi:hypothetical protein
MNNRQVYHNYSQRSCKWYTRNVYRLVSEDRSYQPCDSQGTAILPSIAHFPSAEGMIVSTGVSWKIYLGTTSPSMCLNSAKEEKTNSSRTKSQQLTTSPGSFTCWRYILINQSVSVRSLAIRNVFPHLFYPNFFQSTRWSGFRRNGTEL